MTTKILEGKKIAVLVETEFIPEEIKAYQTRFPELGATVHLMSRLWGNESARFVSDIDEVEGEVGTFHLTITISITVTPPVIVTPILIELTPVDLTFEVPA